MEASAKLNPSRREFLNYALGASVLLAGASTCAGLAWFTTQQTRVGVFGGIFEIDAESLPTDDQPVALPEAQTWLTLTETGLLALDGHCVFDRVKYRWSVSNNRFECPQCGSKYRLDGRWLEDIARRDLDRYVVEVKTAHEIRFTSREGSPVNIEGVESIILHTEQKILGAAHPEVEQSLL